MKYSFLSRSTQRIGSLLSATLVTLVFLAITPAAFAGKFPSGKETTGWNHHGRVKLCAHPGEKRCPTLAIPRGIKDKDVLAIIRTHIVPNAAHDFVILGKKDSYLCADGYGKKLRCQRLAVPRDNVSVADTETRKVYIQNAISLLRATRSAVSPVAPMRVGMSLPEICDAETGECSGGGGDTGGGDTGGGDTGGGDTGGGGDGSGGGQYPYEPIPEPDPSGDPSADDIARSWIQVANDAMEAEFASAGLNPFGRPARDAAECSAWIGSCRDNCSDRGNAGYGVCGVLAGALLTGPPAAKIAGVLFGASCLVGMYQAVDTCKQNCYGVCF